MRENLNSELIMTFFICLWLSADFINTFLISIKYQTFIIRCKHHDNVLIYSMNIYIIKYLILQYNK